LLVETRVARNSILLQLWHGQGRHPQSIHICPLKLATRTARARHFNNLYNLNFYQIRLQISSSQTSQAPVEYIWVFALHLNSISSFFVSTALAMVCLLCIFTVWRCSQFGSLAQSRNRVDQNKRGRMFDWREFVTGKDTNRASSIE
jgi:hypothetical protein